MFVDACCQLMFWANCSGLSAFAQWESGKYASRISLVIESLRNFIVCLNDKTQKMRSFMRVSTWNLIALGNGKSGSSCSGMTKKLSREL